MNTCMISIQDCKAPASFQRCKAKQNWQGWMATGYFKPSWLWHRNDNGKILTKQNPDILPGPILTAIINESGPQNIMKETSRISLSVKRGRKKGISFSFVQYRIFMLRDNCGVLRNTSESHEPDSHKIISSEKCCINEDIFGLMCFSQHSLMHNKAWECFHS